MIIVEEVFIFCKTYPRELCHEGASLKDVPEVDVSAGSTGDQRGGVLVVGAALDEQELVDTQVSIHCTGISERKTMK